MNPTKLVNFTEDNVIKQAVDTVDIYFTNYYAEKFFNSCKDVQNSQESAKAIDLMCGSNHPCTGKKMAGIYGHPHAACLTHTFSTELHIYK